MKGSLPGLLLVLLHAGLLDEVVGLFEGGTVLGVDHFVGDQLAQALEGVAALDAMGEGQQACAVDEGVRPWTLRSRVSFSAPLRATTKSRKRPTGGRWRKAFSAIRRWSRRLSATCASTSRRSCSQPSRSPQTARRSK